VLDKAEYSAFQSTLNSPIVSYRIVSYMHITRAKDPMLPSCKVYFASWNSRKVLRISKLINKFNTVSCKQM